MTEIRLARHDVPKASDWQGAIGATFERQANLRESAQHMTRRDFLPLIGGATAAGTLFRPRFVPSAEATPVPQLATGDRVSNGDIWERPWWWPVFEGTSRTYGFPRTLDAEGGPAWVLDSTIRNVYGPNFPRGNIQEDIRTLFDFVRGNYPETFSHAGMCPWATIAFILDTPPPLTRNNDFTIAGLMTLKRAGWPQELYGERNPNADGVNKIADFINKISFCLDQFMKTGEPFFVSNFLDQTWAKGVARLVRNPNGSFSPGYYTHFEGGAHNIPQDQIRSMSRVFKTLTEGDIQQVNKPLSSGAIDPEESLRASAWMPASMRDNPAWGDFVRAVIDSLVYQTAYPEASNYGLS